MGKTIPSYRIAIEDEISRWKGFRNALSTEKEKQAFDQIIDMSRNLASAGSCACNPILFEPMAMSILVAQQKKIQELENQLSNLPLQKSRETYTWLNLQTATFSIG
jgi:hypothetical protein